MHFKRVELLLAALFLTGAAAPAQQDNKQTAAPGGPVIRTETRLVVVDAVVTDKKGNYVKDLTIKDFKVAEDGKKQEIKVFASESDPSSPMNSQKHYLVLFFDNSSMDVGDQVRARQAAVKFIDANAGPDRLMAIVNFGGSLQIAQNFTADAERLKEVAGGTKLSSVTSNPGLATSGGPRLSTAETDFGARTSLLALRGLAKNLESVTGRKTLVLITSGFPLTEEVRSELTATIATCNKSNVAVYPIDVRGLTTEMPMTPIGGGRRGGAALRVPSGGWLAGLLPSVQLASFTNSFAPPQQGAGRGGGAPAGGSAPSSGASSAGSGSAAGGTRAPSGGAGPTSSGAGRTTGTPSNPGSANMGRGSSVGNIGNPNSGNGNRGPGGGGINPMNPGMNSRFGGAREIVPPFPASASINQQALYMLADGTGGFVISNTNDLLGGLQKIGSEQNHYYILGYSPSESPEGSCHTLKVEVSHQTVRARSGYCNVKTPDLLAGKPVEKDLEARLANAQAGSMATPMQLAFFYTAPDTARVDVTMEIPSADIKFEKVKGKLHSDVNILGIAYKPNGTVGARFSDTVKLEFDDKKQVETFAKKPLHYENQFDIASGNYTFKIAFNSGGEAFGKLESALAVDRYDPAQFNMSGIALIKETHQLNDQSSVETELLEGRTPLIVGNLQLVPSGSNRFKKTDPAGCYVEVYDPLILGAEPVKIGVILRVVDSGGAEKFNSGMAEMTNYIRKGNSMVPLALKLPVANLAPGSYVFELTAADSAGKNVKRSVGFNVE